LSIEDLLAISRTVLSSAVVTTERSLENSCVAGKSIVGRRIGYCDVSAAVAAIVTSRQAPSRVMFSSRLGGGGVRKTLSKHQIVQAALKRFYLC